MHSDRLGLGPRSMSMPSDTSEPAPETPNTNTVTDPLMNNMQNNVAETPVKMEEDDPFDEAKPAEKKPKKVPGNLSLAVSCRGLGCMGESGWGSGAEEEDTV